MSFDEINLKDIPNMVKHCPNCGSGDVIIFQDILKCHNCYKIHSAFEINDEIGE